jgi:transcription factor SOX7/8/10/18 (SOX group E/F)
VHNKNKEKKEKPPTTPEDERRCEEVAQLLLEGKKGDELAAAIRMLDEKNAASPLPAAPLQMPSSYAHSQYYPPRRPSSVPLLDSRFHAITLPSVPFLMPASRSGSPVHNISRNARTIIGQRRPSSALPYVGRSTWGVDDTPMFAAQPAFGYYSPSTSSLHRDDSPLPDVDTSLFDPSFLDSNFGFQGGNGEPSIVSYI